MVRLFDAHGLAAAHDDWGRKRSSLLLHIIKGHCSSSSLPACVSVSGGRLLTPFLKDLMESIRSRMSMGSFDLHSFRRLCELISFDHVDNEDVNLLLDRFQTIVGVSDGSRPARPGNIAELFNATEYMTRSQLAIILSDHGLVEPSSSTVSVLRDSVARHLISGDCCGSFPRPNEGCSFVIAHVPSVLQTDSRSVAAAVLYFVNSNCKIRVLQRVLRLAEVIVPETQKLQDLWSSLSTFILVNPHRSRVAKFIARELMSCENWADLNKIKSCWPSIPSASINQSLIDDFLSETSSSSLQSVVCASCSQDTLVSETETVLSTSFDFTPLTRPDLVGGTPKENEDCTSRLFPFFFLH